MKEEQQDQQNQKQASATGSLWGKVRGGMRHAARGYLDLVYPPVCEFCHGHLVEHDVLYPEGHSSYSAPLCRECQTDFRRQRIDPFCRRCGGPVPFAGQEQCPRCPRGRLHFERVISLGRYRDELRIAVLKMKVPSGELLAHAVGNLLAVERREELLALDPELIVPVPVYWRHRWQIGPGATSVLVDALHSFFRIPVARNILRCRRNMKKQSLLSYRERLENVKGAYAIRRPRAVKGRRILVIDDIMTTGATLNEVSRLLSEAGAASVSAAVVARSDDSKGS